MQGKFKLKSFHYRVDEQGKYEEVKDSKDKPDDQLEICINNYSNKIFIIITEMNKIGTMVCSLSTSLLRVLITH